jgi:glycosyltransferase involved in cell wall biosynthesis
MLSKAMVSRGIVELKPTDLRPLSERPLASVLIANYNYGRFLERAIASVLRQTYQDFELIICDDGSTDNSADVVQSYACKDPRIHLIAKENGGVASALNAAYDASTGDLIALLDADDEFFPDRLDSVVKAAKDSPRCGLFVCPVVVINEHGKILRNRLPRHMDQGWLAQKMLEGYAPVFPPASGVTLRREVAERVLPLPLEWRRWADLVLRERAALLCPVSGLDHPEAYYRIHGANATGMAGPTSLRQVSSAIEQARRFISSQAKFIRQVYGVEIDDGRWEGSRLGELVLVQRLLSGRTLTTSEVRHQSWDGVRSIVWILLSALPRPLGIRLFRLWYGEWPSKRFLRRIIRLNRF